MQFEKIIVTLLIFFYYYYFFNMYFLILVTAVMSIANTVKTSLGPEGLDKMLVDELGVGNSLDINLLKAFNIIK
jgi:hypothetical protein